jgi:hypothetical protein
MNLINKHSFLKFSIIFLLTGLVFAQAPVSDSQKGAVILVSTQGQVQIKRVDTGIYLPNDDVKPGMTFPDGHTFITGNESQAVLLFSNGSLTTLGSNGELSIAQFTQKQFEGSAKKLSELETEPSTSNTKLKLAYGDLVFNVKKLNTGSTFEIESPIGIAGIRGTVGEKSIQFNPVSGEITGTIKMISGWLAFTDKNGNQMDVSAGQSTTTLTSSSGQQIGNTQPGSVSQNDASTISKTSGDSESKTANVSLNSVSNAKNDANSGSSQGSGSSPGNGGNKGASLDSSSKNSEIENHEVIREMGETVSNGASGTAEGAIFVSAVLGYPLTSLKEIAVGLINGATTAASAWIDNHNTSLNNLTVTMRKAVRENPSLTSLTEILAENADALGVSQTILTELNQQFASGQITASQLSQGLLEEFKGDGPLLNPIRGILNHVSQPNPNKGAIVSFFNQLTKNVKKVSPDKETILSFAIQGTLEGIRAGAERANLDAKDIEDLLDSLDAAITPELVQQVPEIQQLNLPSLRAGEEIPILSDPNQEFALSMNDIASNVVVEPVRIPFLIDTDGDGLFDALEKDLGTDINNPDSDGDLLKDGAEYIAFGTDPTNPDTDGDLVSDSVEVGLGEDPTVPNGYGPDTDNDGIPDSHEAIIGTRIDHPDTDSDGWWDAFEIGVGNGLLESQANNPLVRNTTILGTSFTVSPIAGSDSIQTWRINRITFD